jgi:hypothetical protein
LGVVVETGFGRVEGVNGGPVELWPFFGHERDRRASVAGLGAVFLPFGAENDGDAAIDEPAETLLGCLECSTWRDFRSLLKGYILTFR